jgi:hypothetical protein
LTATLLSLKKLALTVVPALPVFGLAETRTVGDRAALEAQVVGRAAADATPVQPFLAAELCRRSHESVGNLLLRDYLLLLLLLRRHGVLLRRLVLARRLGGRVGRGRRVVRLRVVLCFPLPLVLLRMDSRDGVRVCVDHLWVLLGQLPKTTWIIMTNATCLIKTKISLGEKKRIPQAIK